MIHFHKHFFVLVLLLALASALTHAQSQGAGQLVMPLALGVLAFQGKNRHLSPAVSRDDIQVNTYESMWANGQAFLQEGRDDDNEHDVELPDEDNEDEPAPRITGRIQGLTINIQGESIVYQRNGQAVTEASSALEWVMQRYHLQKIELNPASFALNLYPKSRESENRVQVIIPSLTEPLSPSCGKWMDVYVSLLRFATYSSMDEIAAIAEAAMRRQQLHSDELTESEKEEKGVHSYVDVLISNDENLLLLSERLPPMHPESCMFEERQANGTDRIKIDYGFEVIELNGNASRKGGWYYEFNHYKKNDGWSEDEDEQTSSDTMNPINHDAHARTVKPSQPGTDATKLSRKSPIPYIGRYVSPCNSVAAHIRNSSIEAIEKHRVDMMSYRLIQSKKGLQSALKVCCVSGGIILLNLAVWRFTKSRSNLIVAHLPIPEFLLNVQNYYWYKGSISELHNHIQADLGPSTTKEIENLPHSCEGGKKLLKILQNNECPTSELENKLFCKRLINRTVTN